MIGTDKLAGIATDLYAAEGVDASLVTSARASARPASASSSSIDKGENFIILDMGANELMDAAAVDAGEARIAQSDVVMTVLEVPTAAAARAMELGRKHGAKTILNPAPARAAARFDLRSCRLSHAQRERAAHPARPAARRSAAHRASWPRELRRRGVRNVVVTLGRSGALILTDELDTHGAGRAGRGHRHDRRRRRLQFRLRGRAGRRARHRRRRALRRGLRRHRLHQARRRSEPARSRRAPTRSMPKPQNTVWKDKT